MAKLRNLRAYTPGSNETSGVAVDYNDTGSENGAILRKINLNVDIATQNELNEAFTQLSAALSSSSEGWKEADIALSGALKEWAKGEELSGALHTEVTNEATARADADAAIVESLSAYDLSIAKSEDAETSASVYTFYQGGQEKGHIDIAADIFVTSAYFDGTILVLQLANGQTISTDLSGFVDVYEGATTDFATVVVEDNTIKAYVSADLISAAAVDTVVGENGDLSDVNTIYGVKAYVDEKVTGKNVDAEGDIYVNATAADNKVTVAATADLCAAVELAEGAVQSVTADGTILTATEGEGATVTVSPTDKLTAAVAAAETALQSISKGTEGDYVTVTVSEKGDGTTQTVGVAVTVADLTAGTAGLAEATDVKAYVDAVSAAIAVEAAGDAYVSAVADGKTVTVSAQPRTKAVIDKVEAASATWDAALQTVAADHGTYVRTSVSDKESNSQTISVDVVTQEVATAVAGTGPDGLALASDVKSYVDTVSAAIAVTATGDDYVSAWVENGKDVKVAAKAKLTAVVDAVETSADTWNDALQASDIATGTDNGTIAVKGTDVAVAGLGSAAYTLSSAYDKAGDAAALQTAVKNAVNDARFAADAADDYTDIDSIIADLLKVRQALGALKDLNVTLTPAV